MSIPKEYKDKFEEKNITWMKPTSFLKPNDFDYKENEKKQLDFIIDVVCGLMPNSDITTTVELSEFKVELVIRAVAKDEEVNGWDEIDVSWKMLLNDKNFKKYIDDYGYYWGTARYMLNNLPVPFYKLMSYFQESFMKAKDNDSFEYYVKGEKKFYYVRKITLSGIEEVFYVYDRPLKGVKFDDPYLYSLRYSTIDANDLYPTGL